MNRSERIELYARVDKAEAKVDAKVDAMQAQIDELIRISTRPGMTNPATLTLKGKDAQPNSQANGTRREAS